ncbi:MAG TPA: pre-peptidase C-terminal domain-containing protein [Phototrophicaceae bacterium]|nr:pre-peptidase C-terminal domain-containing protein [Phototrophicaceae bacterium]
MDARKLKILRYLIVLLALSIAVPAQAQTTLTMLQPLTGSITPNGTNAWTFNAQSGAVLSFALQATTDQFDPVLTLADSSGHEVVSSDDYDYPTSLNPLLEAITMPRTDTYTLTVSGFKDTAGSYKLTMLPGYSQLAAVDDFNGSHWQAFDSTVVAQQSNGQLQMSIGGAHQSGLAFDSSAATYTDFYAQAQVVNVANPSGWQIGMAFRRQGSSYYLLSINAQGTWRFTLVQNGTETVIHDWTPHPNIVPGAASFSVGVLAKGDGFDFFYNSGYIGSATDQTLASAGTIGLMLGTYSSSPSQSSATFDNLSITTPTLVNGAAVIPEEITAGDGNQSVLALKRRGLIAADGQMSLTLPDSSVQYARPGVNRVMLGRSVTYTNFAIGTTVDLSAAGPGPAGCGLVFRFSDDNNYALAWLDQTGEYGVSQRTGDTFAPGIYGKNQSIGAGTHLLLLVANDNTIDFYIDRQFVGSMQNTAQSGQVGIAVVNFEPNTTACHYTNLWLWNWS